MKRKKRNTPPAIFKKEWKKSPVAVLLAIVSLVIGIVSLGFSIATFTIVKVPAEIKVGVVPNQFSMNNQRLEDVMTLEHHKINNALRFEGLEYRFVVCDNTDYFSYKDLIAALRNGKVDMGYVPMGVYHDWLGNDKDSFDPFEIVGYKKVSTSDGSTDYSTFYRGVLVGSKEKFNVPENPNDKNFWSDIRAMFDQKRCKVWMGDDFSMSSHVVQRRFLLGKGIDLNDKDHIVGRKNIIKSSLVDSILSPTSEFCYMGALSDDEWNAIDSRRRDDLFKIDIDIPIPCDLIVVNKKRWHKISSKDRSSIIHEMRGHENDRQWAVNELGANDHIRISINNIDTWMTSSVVYDRRVEGDSMFFYARHLSPNTRLYDGHSLPGERFDARLVEFQIREEPIKYLFINFRSEKPVSAVYEPDQNRIRVALHTKDVIWLHSDSLQLNILPEKLYAKYGEDNPKLPQQERRK